MQWANKLFGYGLLDPELEKKLTAQQRQQLGQAAMMDSGLAMLAASGPSPYPTSLGQIVAQGVGAGRQAYGQQAQALQAQMQAQAAQQQQDQQRAQYEAMLSGMPAEQAQLYRMFSPQDGVKALAAERKAVASAKARNTGSGPRTVTPGSAVWDPETGTVLYQNPARQSDLATVDIPMPDGRVIRGQRDPSSGNVYDLSGNLISAGPRSSRSGQAGGPSSDAKSEAQKIAAAIEADTGRKLNATERAQIMESLRSGKPFNISADPAASAAGGLGVQRSPEQQKEAELRAENKVQDERSRRQAADQAQLAYQTINSMLNHPGFETAVGLSGQIDPRNYIWGTDAQGARALIDQAQGQTFLQAFESLKGGGQITQVEGEKATAAKGRLQRAQTEKDFRAAAEELRQIAARAYERATGRPIGDARGVVPNSSQAQGGGSDIDALLRKHGALN